MVEYRETNMAVINDGFSQTLRESADYFLQSQQVNILGEGFKDVLTDNGIFDSYVNKLCEGLDAKEEQQMKTLLYNNRTEILQESAVAGIPPIASLSMPTLRKFWAKIALKYAIPTEAVKTPVFNVSYSLPYIIDPITREKYYLPESLRDPNNTLAEKTPLSKDPYQLPMDEVDMLADVSKSYLRGDAIDRNFMIDSVIMTAKDETDTQSEYEEKTVIVRSKMDLNNKLYAEVTATHTDGTKTTDVLIGAVDVEKGTVSLVSLRGFITDVTFIGYVSSESHSDATNVSFDIKRRDIFVPTGEHIEASLPLEYLQDTMAMYNIDGASEVVDVLANITAQKVDQLIYSFLQQSYTSNPTYTGRFDVHPQGLFAGNPKSWLEEIKRVIDFYAIKIKSTSYYHEGYFVIVGNPLDTMLIPNVTWSFNNVTDDKNGIEVTYSIGAMSGANRYTIISSDLIPQGSLTMFMVPTTNKFLTYKYYPYTFNVVHNYLNTMNPNIPSIMMTKRQTVEEFIPLICKINILNNDATLVESDPVPVP